MLTLSAEASALLSEYAAEICEWDQDELGQAIFDGMKENIRRVAALIEVSHLLDGEKICVFPANQSLKNLFDRILKKAEIPKVNALGKKLTAHSFRHTYATRMAQVVGNNPFILKELMGHAKITTTEIYCAPTAPEVMMPLPDLSSDGVVGKGYWEDKEKGAQRIAEPL